MQLIFVVIKRVELVDEIMHALAAAGIKGGTCIDSVGMAKSISDMDNLPMIGVLRAMLSGEDPDQKGKTIFVAVATQRNCMSSLYSVLSYGISYVMPSLKTFV